MSSLRKKDHNVNTTSSTRSVEAGGLLSFEQVVGLALHTLSNSLAQLESVAQAEEVWLGHEADVDQAMIMVRGVIDRMKLSPPASLDEFRDAWCGLAGITNLANHQFQRECAYKNILGSLCREFPVFHLVVENAVLAARPKGMSHA